MIEPHEGRTTPGRRATAMEGQECPKEYVEGAGQDSAAGFWMKGSRFRTQDRETQVLGFHGPFSCISVDVYLGTRSLRCMCMFHSMLPVRFLDERRHKGPYRTLRSVEIYSPAITSVGSPGHKRLRRVGGSAQRRPRYLFARIDSGGGASNLR